MLDDLPAAARHAAAAVALAEERRDGPALAAYLGTQGLIEALRGDPRGHDLLARGAELEAVDEPSGRRAPAAFLRVLRGARFMRGVVATFTEDLAVARAELDAAREETSSLGDESSLPLILRYLSDVELVAGNWPAAEAAAREGYEAAVQTGQSAQQAALAGSRALVAAHVGQSSAARSWAAEALDLAETTGAAFGRLLGTSALGLLELSEERAREATELLGPLTEWADEAGLGEPGARRFVADAVEALLLVGDFNEAERLLAAHERQARELGRTVTSGSAARCRGLLFAARGDPVRGIACIEEVRASGVLGPAPFERARMLLAFGSVHRRARHKRAAREALEESQSVFERLGAALWAKRAHAELARVGGRAPSRGALTPTERRVAALVAEGGSTKEVAAALVVSAKTVEGHLSRIYAKLGVRSRAELARRLANKTL
jgi:DNA-binding CsgD family transcriptional regulator